jgi:Protein of unknown function (DUF1349)
VETSDTNVDVEQCRRQLRKILDSPDFAARRQLSDFLLYASEAAFQGRAHLDQIEIAEHVLHRNKNFNPVDDASVRKIATLTRQRLEAYYAGPGKQDVMIIMLPVRSYIPRSRGREEPENDTTLNVDHASSNKDAQPSLPSEQRPQPLTPPSAATPLHRRRWPFLILIFAAVLVCCLGVLRAHYGSRLSIAPFPVFELTTVRGDFMHTVLDIPGHAIQVGPKLAGMEDVTVRMQFTPEQALQQAGILIFNDADRYVKFGRQFLSRPQIEFGLETEAKYQKPPNTFIYDSRAEDGNPVWMSIRREHSTYKAFLSYDGEDWRQMGNVLQMPDPMPDARIAIFAHHGHSNATPANARFDRLSFGHEFHSYPDGPTDLSQFDGWKYSTTCAQAPLPKFQNDALVLPFGAPDETCHAEFFRPVPEGDWTIGTKLDFVSVNGSAAGLRVRGSHGQFRVIRWDLNGGSLTAENLGFNQAGIRDFPGSPPVVARIDCRRGILYASVSRNELDYVPLPVTVRLSDIGANPEYGITTVKSTWGGPGEFQPARFFYVRQYVRDLHDFR